MSERETGGAAFPRPIGEMNNDVAGSWNRAQDGMTLRDYFAAKALGGWLASYAGCAGAPKANDCATLAYEFADAMLEARKS